MSAYFECGFAVRKPSWHGEEDLLMEWPTDWESARKLAGLLWEPMLVRGGYMAEAVPCQVCWKAPGQLHADECPEFGYMVPREPKFFAADGHQYVVRDDTGVVLGPVTDNYGLVTHEAMGQMMDALLEDGDLKNLKFETAGSCGKVPGQQVYATLWLDEPTTIAGDDTPTYPFMSFLNNHNGSGAFKIVRTSIRVVCWNTFQGAWLSDEVAQDIVIRHTKNVGAMIDSVKDALPSVRAAHNLWVAECDELAALNADDVMVKQFLSEFIPKPEAGVVSDRVMANVEKAQAVFTDLYENSMSTDGHRGTALGLVDASIEYLDHLRGYRNRSTYLRRTLLRPEPLKLKAINLAREVCGKPRRFDDALIESAVLAEAADVIAEATPAMA